MSYSIEWSADRVEELKIHWSSGKSAGAISKIMNISRNAIIGKARRLGLESRRSPRNFVVVKKKPVIEKVKNEGYAYNGRAMKDGKKKHHLTVKKELRLEHTSEVNTTIFGPGKTLFDIERCDCRWPVGQLYCAAPIHKGSYCKEHALIAYIKPRENKT